MSENQENSLKAIKELLGYKFVVPAYQRGYRWGDAEVRVLLEDVWGFAQKLEEEREKQKQGEGGGQNPAPKSTSAPANAGGDQKSDGQNQGDDKKGAEFYCLQPVVVCEVSGGDSASEKKTYNLIDGQQRLTTIYLILKYLGGVSKDEIGKNDQKHFSLEYATRDESTRFLEGLPVGGDLWGGFIGDRSDDSMDIAHFKNACRVIGGFFKDKEQKAKRDQKKAFEDKKIDFKNTLLESCKVLWYEPSREEAPPTEQKGGGDSNADENKKAAEEEIFVRFNAYKIRLTDEENIKALFLSKDNGLEEGEIEKRANFWYDTERKLRKDDDFCYLTLRKIGKKDIVEIDDDKNKQGAAQEDEAKNQEAKKRIVSDNIMRIGVCLEAISDKSRGEMFEEFYELYKNRKKPQKGKEPNFEGKWGELEKCVGVFEGLTSKNTEHGDLDIYHYLGFLTQCGVKPNGLYKMLEKSKDNDPQDALKKEVEDKTLKDFETMDRLVFGQDSEKIKKLLLLFSIALSDSDEKGKKNFEFNKYQLADWSLEHIYPQTSDHTPEWREAVKKYCESDEEYKKPIDLKRLLDEADKSGEKYNQIDRYFQSDGIGNLALLDRGLNSSVGNDVFAKKAAVIKEQKNKFIPLGTEKVFEGNFKAMKDIEIFTPEDQKAYLEAIQKAIDEFLAPKK